MEAPEMPQQAAPGASGYAALGESARSRRAPALLCTASAAGLLVCGWLAGPSGRIGADGPLRLPSRAALQGKELWCEELNGDSKESSPMYWIPDMNGPGLNLTVMTYSMEQDGEADDQKRFQSRGWQDVMGFQGCSDARRLVQFGVTRKDVVFQGAGGLCMAYKNATFTLVDQGLQDVAEDKDTGERRGAQWMRLRHSESGKHVLFVNVRGPRPRDSGGICGPETTSANLLRLVVEHSEAGDATIVVGNLNSGENSAVVTGLAKRLTRVFSSEQSSGTYILTNVGGKGGSTWQEDGAIGANLELVSLGPAKAPRAEDPAAEPQRLHMQAPSEGSDSASVPFDCAAGYSNWRAGWSNNKKKWCCQNANVNCEEETTSQPYDCEAGYSNWLAGWSDNKKQWCCQNAKRGCDADANTTEAAATDGSQTTTTFTVTTVTVATTTTTTPWCMAKARKPPAKLWSPSSAGAAARFKMLTINLVWWNLGDELSEGDRPEEIIRNTGDPYHYDAVSLQECRDPGALLQGLGAIDKSYNVLEGAGELCMLYRTDIWTLEGHGDEPVAIDGMGDQDGAEENRSVQWVRLKHPETGQTFFFANFHGPMPMGSGGACGGEVTAHRILGVIAQNAHEGDSIILAGAFNAKGSSTELQVLQEHGLHVFKVSNDGTSELGTDFILSNSDAGALVTSANMGRGGRFHDVLGAIFEAGKRPEDAETSGGSDSFYTWTTSTVTTSSSTTTTTTTSTITGPQPFQCPTEPPSIHSPLWSTTGKPTEVRVASLWLNSTGGGDAGLPFAEDGAGYDLLAFQGCSDPGQLTALGQDFGVVIHRYGLCTAYKMSRWNVQDQGEEVIAEDVGSGPSGKRGAQWVRLQLTSDSSRAVLVVNHHGPGPFDSGGKCGGKSTARGLLETIHGHAKEGDAVVLAGRFNAGANSETVSELQLHIAHVCTKADVGGSFIFSNGELKATGDGKKGDKAAELGAVVQVGSVMVSA